MVDRGKKGGGFRRFLVNLFPFFQHSKGTLRQGKNGGEEGKSGLLKKGRKASRNVPSSRPAAAFEKEKGEKEKKGKSTEKGEKDTASGQGGLWSRDPAPAELLPPDRGRRKEKGKHHQVVGRGNTCREVYDHFQKCRGAGIRGKKGRGKEKKKKQEKGGGERGVVQEE